MPEEPIRQGDYVVRRVGVDRIALVTDVGMRTEGERNVGGRVRTFFGFSGIYVLSPGGRTVLFDHEEVELYRHATPDEVAAAQKQGTLPAP